MTGQDPLARLENAGFPVRELPEEQRDVLRALSDGELAALLEIKRRLDAAEPEVRAHEAGLVGGLLF